MTEIEIFDTVIYKAFEGMDDDVFERATISIISMLTLVLIIAMAKGLDCDELIHEALDHCTLLKVFGEEPVFNKCLVLALQRQLKDYSDTEYDVTEFLDVALEELHCRVMELTYDGIIEDPISGRVQPMPSLDSEFSAVVSEWKAANENLVN